MSSKSFTFHYLEHICELEKCCATCTCIQNALADLFTQYGSYNGLAAYRLNGAVHSGSSLQCIMGVGLEVLSAC